MNNLEMVQEAALGSDQPREKLALDFGSIFVHVRPTAAGWTIYSSSGLYRFPTMAEALDAACAMARE